MDGNQGNLTACSGLVICTRVMRSEFQTCGDVVVEGSTNDSVKHFAAER